ncbi:MAG: hypothetical protein LBB90_06775, partial [Tannerella sp.]|nr:hypothetical protein [Tannerella sp.]
FDSARTEGIAEGKAEGIAQGIAKGMTQGLAKGKAEGLAEGMAQAVIAAAQNNFSTEQIRLFSGLSEDRIREILERGNCTGG